MATFSAIYSLLLVYIVPRNSIQLLDTRTTKFQVEREPVCPSLQIHFVKLQMSFFDKKGQIIT